MPKPIPVIGKLSNHAFNQANIESIVLIITIVIVSILTFISKNIYTIL